MKRIRSKLATLTVLTSILLAACDSATVTPTPSSISPTPAGVPTATLAVRPTNTQGGITFIGTATPTDLAPSIDLARRLLLDMATGDYGNAVSKFNADMSSHLPADKVKEIWDGLAAQYGQFKDQGTIEAAKQGAYDVIIIQCIFEKSTLDMSVAVDEAGRVAGLYFSPSAGATPPAVSYTPPNYVHESSFTEKELSFGDPEYVLTGTLTMPNTPGPHPAVVLVQGTGALDRDETIGPNKPFRDLAWGLASQGIAVFRYDKRTFLYAAKMAQLLDTSVTVQDEVIDDAVLALELIKGTDGIEPSRVFLVGHSLGGMLAPLISEATEAESGFIALSAPSRPFEDIVLEQLTYLANLDGTISQDEQAGLDKLKTQVQTVKDLKPGTAITPDQLPLNLPASYWLSIQGYNPASEAKKLTEPMLILQGERDYQVTMEDFAIWQEMLKDKEDATLKSYPGLNHIYMAGSGPVTPNEYAKEGHVAESVINDIGAWIGRH